MFYPDLRSTGSFNNAVFSVFLLPYFMKYSFEITQTFTQNAKWANKDVCSVFFNFFEMNVKQQLLLGSKFCDTELR